MTKIIAKQVPYDVQESDLTKDLFEEGGCYDEFLVYGNDEMQPWGKLLVLMEEFEECFDDLVDIFEEPSAEYNEKLKQIQELFRHPVSARIDDWKKVYRCQNPAYILTAMTGKRYCEYCMQGSQQRDWQFLYYPAYILSQTRSDWEFLHDFAVRYWNNGDEWRVEDGDDITYVYTTDTDDDRVKAEIASATGYQPDDILLKKFQGYQRIPVWED